MNNADEKTDTISKIGCKRNRRRREEGRDKSQHKAKRDKPARDAIKRPRLNAAKQSTCNKTVAAISPRDPRLSLCPTLCCEPLFGGNSVVKKWNKGGMLA
jgi:hypothetical protein